MAKRREIRNSTAEFLIFQIEGKEQSVEVYYKDKTVCCTQKAMGMLFDCTTSKMARTKRTIKADGKVIMDDNDKTDDKRTIKADDKRTIKADDKRTIIIEYIHRNGEVKTEDLVKLLSSSTTRIKMLLYQLVDEGILVSCGGNRNRTYKLKEREQS